MVHGGVEGEPGYETEEHGAGEEDEPWLGLEGEQLLAVR